MDVYDYLDSQNLIKKEKDIINKRKKKELKTKLSKYNINIVKLDNSESDEDDIIVQTEMDYNNNDKNKKIIDYTEENNINNEISINNLYEKYKEQLKDYFYINDEIDNLKLGGYVRYVNLNEELRFGGILIAIIDKSDLFKMKLVLKNTTNNIWKISYINNYIFYKNHKTKNDKFRNLFLKVAMIE